MPSKPSLTAGVNANVKNGNLNTRSNVGVNLGGAGFNASDQSRLGRSGYGHETTQSSHLFGASNYQTNAFSMNGQRIENNKTWGFGFFGAGVSGQANQSIDAQGIHVDEKYNFFGKKASFGFNIPAPNITAAAKSALDAIKSITPDITPVLNLFRGLCTSLSQLPEHVKLDGNLLSSMGDMFVNFGHELGKLAAQFPAGEILAGLVTAGHQFLKLGHILKDVAVIVLDVFVAVAQVFK